MTSSIRLKSEGLFSISCVLLSSPLFTVCVTNVNLQGNTSIVSCLNIDTLVKLTVV
jgi:hypothetical protein